MTEETKKTNEGCCNSKKSWNKNAGSSAGGGAVYCFGLIGALFYYIPNAHSFSAVIMAILKSIVWPAMIVYQMLGFLSM